MRYEVHSADAASTLTELWGYSAENTDAAAQTTYIKKTDTSGDKLIRIALAAGGSQTVSFSDPLSPGDKLFIDVGTNCAITVWGK